MLPALQRFDERTLSAFAAMIQEPITTAAEFEACINRIKDAGWDPNIGSTVFTPSQVHQIRLPHKCGGMGIPSMVERSPAAFIARIGAVLTPALQAFSPVQRDIVLPALLTLPLMQHVHSALNHLVLAGVPRARLTDLLSASWTAWALPTAEGEADDNGEQLQQDLTAAAAAADGQGMEEPAEGGEAAEERAHRNMQSVLCACLADARLATLRAQLTAIPAEEERLTKLAQQRSQAGKGGMAFLSVDPSNDRMLTIAGHLLREAIRRGLRILRPATGGICSICPSDLDGAHALACTQSGEQTFRHEFVKKAIADLLKARAKVHTTCEDSTPFVGTEQPDRRMDIVVAGGQMQAPLPMMPDGTLVPNVDTVAARNKGLLVDVFLTDPAAQQFRRRAAQEDGAALGSGVARKFQTYGDTSIAYTLIPFGVEIHGRLCKHSHVFIRAVAEHQTSICDGAYPYSHVVMKWRQYVSIALQRACSDSVHRV
jgi:hypothetical protein